MKEDNWNSLSHLFIYKIVVLYILTLSQTISVSTFLSSVITITVSFVTFLSSLLVWCSEELLEDCDDDAAGDTDAAVVDNEEYFLCMTMMAMNSIRHRKEAHRIAWCRKVWVEFVFELFSKLESSKRCNISLMARSPSFISKLFVSCASERSPSMSEVYQWLGKHLGFTWLLRLVWWRSQSQSQSLIWLRWCRGLYQPISFITFLSTQFYSQVGEGGCLNQQNVNFIPKLIFHSYIIWMLSSFDFSVYKIW